MTGGIRRITLMGRGSIIEYPRGKKRCSLVVSKLCTNIVII